MSQGIQISKPCIGSSVGRSRSQLNSSFGKSIFLGEQTLAWTSLDVTKIGKRLNLPQQTGQLARSDIKDPSGHHFECYYHVAADSSILWPDFCSPNRPISGCFQMPCKMKLIFCFVQNRCPSGCHVEWNYRTAHRCQLGDNPNKSLSHSKWKFNATCKSPV